ncbi:ABC transporter ATP-binding protein [Streptomyces spectabilis]|uniref:ABC transporter ATP-binding protein n=1 Tax=Streptomyces spectabilis TaxID=68270 RepID=A0A5P2XE01_STRST|nr:ABC transporter ATP-binding protein [Streptomyces spectabilis]MBB5106851.1 ABC-2 type transport system ATP-binding protein [Streptomyces spectabilis]MCI3906418.1 ABC transporter ATP-binding protein [Streptomyces spectabilis]QEV63267.1 ABC transporter ATP-binding protein [Streptomyces spectabilis]
MKQYAADARRVVDGLSFEVHRGEVFGLLGPNGAGKSTTVGMMTTRVRPTSGEVVIDGVDVVARPRQAKRVLAVVPQRNNLDRSLSVRQNLLFHATYHGIPRAERQRRADELLEQMGLADYRKSKVDDMSGGQVQRVMIARALIHRPSVLFLDEPATGLDPQARLFVHERVAELSERGVTVVLTTHDMDEAAKLCDRVGIVDRGTLLALDTPEGLGTLLPAHSTLALTVRSPQGAAPVVKLLVDLPGVRQVDEVDPETPPADACRLRVYTDTEPVEALQPALAALTERDYRVTDVGIGKVSLEDVFLHLTGKNLR